MDQKVTAVWSPDGSQIAASTGRCIYLWDRANRALLKTIVLQNGWEREGGRPSLSFSSDGSLLAHGSRGYVGLWNLEGPADVVLRPERVLGLGSIGYYAALSPDGRQAITPSTRGALLWDAESGNLLRVFDLGSTYEWPVFSGDGQRVAIWAGCSVRIWDLTTGRLISQVPLSGPPSVSDDGRWLAGEFEVDSTQEARVYETTTGRVRFALPLEDGGRALITPDGTQVLVTAYSTDSAGVWHTELMVYDVATGANLWSRAAINGVPAAIAPDGAKAVLVMDGETSSIFQAYDLSNGDMIVEVAFPRSWGWPQIGGFSPDGSRFLVRTSRPGPNPDLLCVLDLNEQVLKYTWERLVDTWPYALGWNADGSQVIEMGSDRIVHRDVATGAVVREVALSKDGIFADVVQAAFSSSDQEILAVDYDAHSPSPQRAMVLDALTGEVLSQVSAERCWAVNDRLLSAEYRQDEGCTLTVRDAHTSRVLHEPGYPGDIRSVAMSTDGRRLALSHFAGRYDEGSGTTSLLIDLSDGAELWRREEVGYHANGVVGLLPDGSRILLAQGCLQDSDLYAPFLWDWASNEPRVYYFGHGGVNGVRVSRDGSAMLVSYGASTGCSDGSYVSHLALWDVHRGQLEFGLAAGEPVISEDWKRTLTANWDGGEVTGWTTWDLATGSRVHTHNGMGGSCPIAKRAQSPGR
jgi:WD40 repeat protein